MKLRLFGDRLVVDPVKQKRETESGLVLVVNPGPDILGTIVARGEGVHDDALQPGVIVFYPESAGQEIVIRTSEGRQSLIALRESDILALVEEL